MTRFSENLKRKHRATLEDRIADITKAQGHNTLQSISLSALCNAADAEFEISELDAKENTVMTGIVNAEGDLEFTDSNLSKGEGDFESINIYRDFRFSTDSMDLGESTDFHFHQDISRNSFINR